MYLSFIENCISRNIPRKESLDQLQCFPILIVVCALSESILTSIENEVAKAALRKASRLLLNRFQPK